MTLGVLDAFGEVPPDLVGKYDVVHLRMWCCVVRGNDPIPLIRHAMNLLSRVTLVLGRRPQTNIILMVSC
jgi:hypothetical protein